MGPSQLMARKLGQSRMVVVAAPTYLARRGVPQTPYDLDAHNCIAFNFARHVDEWSFIVDGNPTCLCRLAAMLLQRWRDFTPLGSGRSGCHATVPVPHQTGH